jgi:PAS domain S-box-containing protein
MMNLKSMHFETDQSHVRFHKIDAAHSENVQLASDVTGMGKLAMSNERENFRNLFKQSRELVCILSGPEHRFEFVNEAHIRVLGFDATGMTVREAQPESVEVHGILDTVYETGRTAELREIPVTIGNSIRCFNLTYAARYSESGEVDGVMILGSDITDEILVREELRESKRRYQVLFDHSPLPKLIFDLETLKIVDVNETAIKHYGYSREEFLSMTKADLRPAQELHQLKESVIRKHADTEVEHHMGVHHIKKNGDIMEVEINSLDVRLNGRRVRICAIVDVTEKSRAEVELQRLIASLQEAKTEAERANNLKSSFLANMSHEIRTPLGAIIGFTDLLKDASISREEFSNYINIITRNCEQLGAIINDILDLSKVEAGFLTLDFTETAPAQVAADVVSLLRVKADEKGIALELKIDDSMPEIVVTDGLRLHQVLMNVVGNAIKFTPSGFVKVRCFGATDPRAGRPRLYLEVQDSGIGIPESQLEKIFNVFVQADGTSARKFGGTGLGLALSRQLARNLGGDVSVVQSSPEKGTTFLISVLDQPAKKSNVTATPAGDQTPRELSKTVLKGKNILVVDDSADNRQLLWHFLSSYGANVDFSENGVSGYRRALAGNFDIVLMDIQMPEMDGYTATQKLREAGYQMPVIALTAHAMSEVRKKCMNVGCTDHLTKPIKLRELIEAVVKHTT